MDDGYLSVLCAPCFQYVPVELLLVCTTLFFWRSHSHRQAAGWKAGEKTPEDGSEDTLSAFPEDTEEMKQLAATHKSSLEQKEEEHNKKVKDLEKQVEEMKQAKVDAEREKKEAEEALEKYRRADSLGGTNTTPLIPKGREFVRQISRDLSEKKVHHCARCRVCLQKWGNCMQHCCGAIGHACTEVSKWSWYQFRILFVCVFQWWLVMLLCLSWCLVSKLLQLADRFNVGIEFLRNFPNQPPQELLDADVPIWLVNFVLCSFVALAILYCFAVLAVLLQLLTHFLFAVTSCKLHMAGFGLVSYPRDVAIAVCLLPVFYGLMALEGIALMLDNITNRENPSLTCSGWNLEQQQDIHIQAYEASFALADMYEAWTLYLFGEMVSKMLQAGLAKNIQMAVYKSFEDLLLIDVKGFVFVGVMSAFYTIVPTYTQWRFGFCVCDEHKWVCAFQPYLVGANWCVSSVAIYNLFTIEHKFEKVFNKSNFHGAAKFWSIKLMVVVSFWMGLVMAVVKNYFSFPNDQASILDAAFRIYVMTFVAVLNVYAWWPFAGRGLMSGWYAVVDEACGESDKRHEMVGDTMGKERIPAGAAEVISQVLNLPLDKVRDKNKVIERVQRLTESELHVVLHLGSQIGWAWPQKSDEPEVKGRMPTLSRTKTVDSTSDRIGMTRRPNVPDFKTRKAKLQEFLCNFYLLE